MSQDLFDDSTMTFGEHLDVLRTHLIRALLGASLCIAAAFFFSQKIVVAIQEPVTTAMRNHFGTKVIDPQKFSGNEPGAWERLQNWVSGTPTKGTPTTASPASETTGSTGTDTPPATDTPASDSQGKMAGAPGEAAKSAASQTIVAQIDAVALIRNLHRIDPKRFPEPPADAPASPIDITLTGENLGKVSRIQVAEEDLHPRTDTPDEAFMIYMKVSIIAGLVLASPWVIYQLWLFVAAGLYPHEQKYVYTYLPTSIVLFLGGAFFAYFVVMPYVLDFLFSFNAWMELRPEIKINSWISFALTVSLMFGVSFQLPLVMLFLERISIFTAADYREKRRIAILAIAVISMILTPSDPVSMTLMMIPLCVLYELGILLCVKAAKRSPFESQPV